MKMLPIVVILLCAICLESNAQADTLLINLRSGTTEKIAVSDIQKIRFENISGIEYQDIQLSGMELKGNYPNPFENQTNIEFEINNSGTVEIVVFDNGGNRIQKLECRDCQSGRNSVLWNCMDKNNNRVQSGVYYYEVRFGKEVQAKKMVLVK